MVVHEQNERAALRGRKLKANSSGLREKRASLRMGARPDGAAGIVQEQREIEDKRVLELLEQLPVRPKFRVRRPEDLVELVDAHQGVFVRSVAMEKFVLHETGELPKLRHVAAQKIDAVHHAKDPAHFAFTGNDGFEYLPRFRVVAKAARDQPEIAGEEIGQFRAQIQLPVLRQLKGAHHRLRMFCQIGPALKNKLPVSNSKMIDPLFARLQSRQETKERAGRAR